MFRLAILFFVALLPTSALSQWYYGPDSRDCSPAHHLAVPDVTDMPYSKARATLLKAGWQPVRNPEILNPENFFGMKEEMIAAGYFETEVCSPVGTTPCKFHFQDIFQAHLVVQTYGEFGGGAEGSVFSFSFICPQ